MLKSCCSYECSSQFIYTSMDGIDDSRGSLEGQILLKFACVTSKYKPLSIFL